MEYKHPADREIKLAIKILLVLVICEGLSWAVTSKVTYHTSSDDFLKGQTENVVISSRGTVQLGRASETLADEDFKNVWSINSIVLNGGTIFIGTSPNGGVYKYSLGKLTEIYSAELTSEETKQSGRESDEPNEPNSPTDVNDVNIVSQEEYLKNEHIFAMATDISGRLLVGISGRKCALCRVEAGQLKTIFEPNDAKYIFAIDVSSNGDIYLGTGPEGKVYKLNSFGEEAKIVYDSTDKNILSLVLGRDNYLYAGSDTRGLVYKIDTVTGRAMILYDSDQPEITALLPTFEDALYAAATSAKVVQAQREFSKQLPLAGRPETKPEDEETSNKSDSALKLEIANTKKTLTTEPPIKKPSVSKRAKPGQLSYIYKVSKEGFVTDIFTEAAVFFVLAEEDEGLLLGTGNGAELFSIDPVTEDEKIVYEDKQASQITAIAVSSEGTYLGTANPAKLIKLKKTFASEGTYISSLIDASQPTNWGKLQIEADVPEGCKVLVACRSGNVSDVNDLTFSDWTELEEITEPVQLRCPLGRYCQYKLVLRTSEGLQSPVVREVAVANTIPNLAPKVESVSVERIDKPDKTGVFQIKYEAKDDNGDKLIYKIDFRKIARVNWIELEDEVLQEDFEWDSRTVEDGRYEIRVTASDERSNTTATKLTNSRVSEPVVVDNTGPVIENYSLNGSTEVSSEPVEVAGDEATLKLSVLDKFSAIGEVHYTVDSNVEWIGTVPNDLVYDTTRENFTIKLKELKTGEHIISLRLKDNLGNTTYRSFAINVVK